MVLDHKKRKMLNPLPEVHFRNTLDWQVLGMIEPSGTGGSHRNSLRIFCFFDCWRNLTSSIFKTFSCPVFRSGLVAILNAAFTSACAS
jgi:hypothetical protein